jgi:mannosyl-3-phosphoglycerate phosphatase
MLIFTDLDGTLLDLETYSARQVAPLVARLLAAKVPVIFCSSKTRTEQEVYRQALDIRHPFIVENGSAICVPKGYFAFALSTRLPAPWQVFSFEKYELVVLGTGYDRIRYILEKARARLGVDVAGYGDMGLEEVMTLTGLDEVAAARAARRDFSETLLKGTFEGESWDYFVRDLHREGIQVVAGSRFYTLSGIGSDKGRAIKLLRTLYQAHPALREPIIGLGDSPNDLPMLRAVTHPYLVQRPSGHWIEADLPGLQKVEGIGPAGWIAAVEPWLVQEKG